MAVQAEMCITIVVHSGHVLSVGVARPCAMIGRCVWYMFTLGVPCIFGFHVERLFKWAAAAATFNSHSAKLRMLIWPGSVETGVAGGDGLVILAVLGRRQLCTIYFYGEVVVSTAVGHICRGRCLSEAGAQHRCRTVAVVVRFLCVHLQFSPFIGKRAHRM